jgi:DNA polymerase IV (DinB-like DNA polymerase)
MRLIALVDMDYFFAACEELRSSGIKGKPVVVGADPKGGAGRGVVSACNYVARKFGIRSGMPISMAYRLKRDAVFLPVDYDYYEAESKKVMTIIKAHADRFEQVSIDEAFADVSVRAGGYEGAVAIAVAIKEEINGKLGLPCSVGVGTNKLIAKMACEDAKPNGVKLVKEEEAAGFLAGKPVGDLYGIGKKTNERLKAMGYSKIGDLAKANVMDLVEKFGSYGADIYHYANGNDDSEVQENYEVKSIGRERTFETDTDDARVVSAAIWDMSREVAAEVKKGGFAFKVVTLKIRYPNFEEHMHSKSLSHRSDNVEEIARSSLELFEMHGRGEKVRKVGVRVSNLVRYTGQKRIEEYLG